MTGRIDSIRRRLDYAVAAKWISGWDLWRADGRRWRIYGPGLNAVYSTREVEALLDGLHVADGGRSRST